MEYRDDQEDIAGRQFLVKGHAAVHFDDFTLFRGVGGLEGDRVGYIREACFRSTLRGLHGVWDFKIFHIPSYGLWTEVVCI